MNGLVSERIEFWAKQTPNKPALKIPRRLSALKYTYEEISFARLQEMIERIQNNLQELGVHKGERVLVFVKPGRYLAALTFALFRIGAIPVFIDPGMGKKNLLTCIEKVKPTTLIAEPIVHLIKTFTLLFGKKAFSSVKRSIKTDGLFPFFTPSLKSFVQSKAKTLAKLEKPEARDLAAILFTSGGTGTPKGVQYDHSLFKTQTELLQKMFSLDSTEIDCPGFPLFSLFTMSMGMTSIIPDMDASKPSKANPQKLIQNIQDQKVSFVAGSPAIWEPVADYCLQHGITLPTLKYVVMFGAPVSLAIHKKFSQVLPNGTTYTPYGATEALPISLVDGKTLLSNFSERMEKGLGTCLGTPVSGVSLKIIPISDQATTCLEAVPAMTIGEIIVRGEMVTKAYDQNPEATKLAKIYDDQSFWHRMGDIGYLDHEGVLWFCGRLGHRVSAQGKLMSSIQCEAIFNQHSQVKRTALVGIGTAPNQIPAIIVELKRETTHDKEILKKELRELALKYEHTKDIEKFFFKESFPVDVRHNIKIDRLKLKAEVEQGMLL